MTNQVTKNLVSSTISAFITNLGKYNEGELVGKWHDFPTTHEEISQTFLEIGVDGVNYEEFFITDYDIDIEGVYNCLSEYESLDEINYFASKISDMNSSELEIFENAIKIEDCNNLKNLINLTENLDCFDYLEGVTSDYDLGDYWLNESGCYAPEAMGHLHRYFDYESFGRDIAMDENGAYTANGYIRENGNFSYEEYDGKNIPDEYRVFSLPKYDKVNKKCLKKL